MHNILLKFLSELPPSATKVVGWILSLLTGLVAAFAMYYVLYRIGLPSKPFIYVAF